jgi:TrkA-N domain
VIPQPTRRPAPAARLTWAAPATATGLLTALLAWAAVRSAHSRYFPRGPHWWQWLRPDDPWTLPVLLGLWAAALALYWLPRRRQDTNVALLALLSMVIVGGVLGEASFLPCAKGQAPVLAPLGWVLELFTGQVQPSYDSTQTGCPGNPPLALQVATVFCLGATFVGVVAAGAVLWRREIDRLKTRFVGELTMMTGLDEMTLALLRKLVADSGAHRVVVVEADPNHPLLEETRATGARVIIADPGRAVSLRPVLTHLGKPSVRQVFALHPGAQDNDMILSRVREVLRQAPRHSEHRPHIVARVDDPRHADTWRGNHIGPDRLWLEDALSPYETTAVFAVRAVLKQGARTLVLCGDTTLALAVLIEAARSAWEQRELRAAAREGGSRVGGGSGLTTIRIMADRAADLQREFDATASAGLREALPAVAVDGMSWQHGLLGYLDSASPAAGDCAVVITDHPTAENMHESGRIARLHPETLIYAQSVDGVGGAGLVFDRLHHFRAGFLVDGDMPADTWTRLARHNHEWYRLRWPVPPGSPRESARRPWEQLDEFLREENIRQVRQVLSSAVGMERQWRPLRAVPDGSVVELTDSQVLKIAYDEHSRWYARRIAAGWRPPRAGEPEDYGARINASVAPWAALPEATRSGNVQHIRSILERLEAIGYVAVLPDAGPKDAACFHRRGEVRAGRLRSAGTWTAADGTVMQAAPGDWRIQDGQGNVRTVRDAQFRATHTRQGAGRWARTGQVRAWQVSEPTTVRTLEGRVTAAAGDWIVQGPGGERWPVPAALFDCGHRECAGHQ